MASSSDAIFGITTLNLAVPAGATNAVLLAPGAYVRASLIKYLSGGSISIFGVPQGASLLTGTSLVTGFSNSYLLSTSEILSIGGPVTYYIAATGLTAVASILQGLSTNTPLVGTNG
jgi:hypothetical protein